MENFEYYTDEQRHPFHSQQNSANDTGDRENANTGDWEDERDKTGKDPDHYDTGNTEEGGNDNSGGAGSSGSAATNS